MSWGNAENTKERALVKLMWPASFGMGLASYCRLMAYNVGAVRQKSFPAIVLSVGNITCGGTGKTPVTIDLADRLLKAGRKVAILSRGYKRLSKDRVLVVSDGKSILTTCMESGDEPYLMAKALPDAVVIVGAKRVETAQVAIDQFGCDTILLDDGFQHLPIARDIDVVLVDYNDELENDHLLPAGRLREPLTALSRASWIVITKVPESPDLSKLERIHQMAAKYAPQAEVSSTRFRTNDLNPLGCSDVTIKASTLAGTRVFAFSAIARPERFIEQLESRGALVVGQKNFGDHHWYSHKDAEAIRKAYESSGAEMVITTEKDSVKLTPAIVKDLPLAVLKQKVEWLGPVPVALPRAVPTANLPIS